MVAVYFHILVRTAPRWDKNDDQNSMAICKNVDNLFQIFLNAKQRSGDGWEALFTVVLLLRLFTGNCDAPLLSFANSTSFTVSYNAVWRQNAVSFSQCSTIKDFAVGIDSPPDGSGY